MKRLIFVLVCMAMLCTPAAAHSGRTDANGGHTDSSTGEYHYHHGYPAHQHKDMDGDGKKDCPYEFDDKTGSSSGTGGSGKGSSTVKEVEVVKEVKVPYVPQSVKGWIAFLIILCGILLGIVIYISGKINEAKEQSSKDIAAIRSILENRYGKKYLLVLAGAPSDIEIDSDDNLPYSTIDGRYLRYGQGCTYFATSRTMETSQGCYHSWSHCSSLKNASTKIREVNFTEVVLRDGLTRCKVCGYSSYHLEWQERYIRLSRLFKK